MRRTDQVSIGLHANNIREVIQSTKRVDERFAAIGCAGAHFGLVGQCAQHLAPGGEQVLLIRCAGACRLYQPLADVRDVPLHAVESLHQANQRSGKQPDDDPEEKTEAERPPPGVRWDLFCWLILRRDQRGPVGQVAP